MGDFMPIKNTNAFIRRIFLIICLLTISCGTVHKKELASERSPNSDDMDALCKAVLRSASYTLTWHDDVLTDTLLKASSNNSVDIMRAILKERPELINARQQYFYEATPLILAARANSIEAVEFLLSIRGINVHAVDVSGNTALSIAANEGRTEVFGLIQGYGEITEILRLLPREEMEKLLLEYKDKVIDINLLKRILISLKDYFHTTELDIGNKEVVEMIEKKLRNLEIVDKNLE